MRLDAAGNVLWVRQVGSEGGDYGHGLAVDAQGGVHLLMPARALDLQSESLHVIRFGPGGNRLASTVLALQDEFVTGGGIELDGAGNAYVAGGTTGLWGMAKFGGTDVYLLHIDGDRDTTWVQRVGSAAQETLSPGRHLVVEAEGASLIVGITGGPFAGPGSHVGDDGLFLIRIDVDGAEVWRR